MLCMSFKDLIDLKDIVFGNTTEEQPRLAKTITCLPGFAFRCVLWDLNGSTSHQMPTNLPILPSVLVI